MKRRRKFRQRRRFRRQQRRMKIRARSLNMTTQIPVDAFNMLHISTESNTQSIEVIERYELTMPFDQRPVLFLIEPFNSMDKDYYSSFV